MDYQTISPIDHYTALDGFSDESGALSSEAAEIELGCHVHGCSRAHPGTNDRYLQVTR